MRAPILLPCPAGAGTCQPQRVSKGAVVIFHVLEGLARWLLCSHCKGCVTLGGFLERLTEL